MSKEQQYEEYFGEDDVKTIKEEETSTATDDSWGVDDGSTSTVDKAETTRQQKRGKHHRRRGKSCSKSSGSWDGGGGAPWIVGLVFILFGGGLLASNLFGFSFNNWWALFFLIPIGGTLSSAMYLYQKEGRLTEAVAGPLFVAGLLTLLMSMFLFNLSWNLFWPGLLILIGLKMILRTRTASS